MPKLLQEIDLTPCEIVNVLRQYGFAHSFRVPFRNCPMNPLITWLLSLLMTILADGMRTGVAVMQEDESLLEQFGNLLGGAFGGGAREAEPQMPAQVMFGQPEAGAVPTEKDRTEHIDRLKAYSGALQVWITQACVLTDAQQTTLKEVADKMLADEITRFAKRRNPQHQNQMFPETFPILFTRLAGAADGFQTKLLAAIRKELLTREQQDKLTTALADRAKAHREAFRTYIVAIFDKELFLTTEQRTALASELAAKGQTRIHPLYAFQPQSYYLPYESLGVLLPKAKGKTFLEESQEKRLQDLYDSTSNNNNLVFQTSSGPDEWQKQIAEAGKAQREQYQRAAAVRVDYFRTELKLTPEQSEFLTTAGKGASIRALGDWKETTQQTIDQMQQQMAQMGGNFGFGAQNMNTNTIEQNEIWAEAVKSVTSSGAADDSLKQRKDFHTTATADMLLALLDEELWLMPEQHERLRVIIRKSLPNTSDPTQSQEYVRDVVLLAFPLFKTREQDRNEILTEPQREAWKQLQSFFQWQQQGNYMQIPLRNQGGSVGFMLSD